jgi:hypothetical protein
MSSCYQAWKSRRSGGAKQIVFIFYFLYLFFIFTYEQLLPDMEKQEVWWRKIETGALQTTSRVPLVGKRISLGGEQRTITSGFFLFIFFFALRASAPLWEANSALSLPVFLYFFFFFF